LARIGEKKARPRRRMFWQLARDQEIVVRIAREVFLVADEAHDELTVRAAYSGSASTAA
jgi:DNA-binding ferritin-like protein